MHSVDKQVSFDDEPLILVDSNDREVGNLNKVACHEGEGVLHRAFSVFILNGSGKVLLQQRSQSKKLWPLYWSNSCCSHPRRGEDIHEAADRRIMQELGIEAELTRHYEFEYRASYKNIGVEHELCSVFTGLSQGEIVTNKNEIEDWRWVSVAELTRQLAAGKDRFTPWLKLEWANLCSNYQYALTVE
jgi:isopentenyl-diphosphate Delta-isomerase